MTDYKLACPECGHDASEHMDGSCAVCFAVTPEPRDSAYCNRTAASLYAAECARLATMTQNTVAMSCAGMGIELTAARAECERLAHLLDGVADLMVTQGHPEFGIEVTLVRENQYHVTVTNQPSWLEGITTARTALDATEDKAARTEGTK